MQVQAASTSRPLGPKLGRAARSAPSRLSVPQKRRLQQALCLGLHLCEDQPPSIKLMPQALQSTNGGVAALEALRGPIERVIDYPIVEGESRQMEPVGDIPAMAAATLPQSPNPVARGDLDLLQNPVKVAAWSQRRRSNPLSNRRGPSCRWAASSLRSSQGRKRGSRSRHFGPTSRLLVAVAIAGRHQAPKTISLAPSHSVILPSLGRFSRLSRMVRK
jgi:hypothetical protein